MQTLNTIVEGRIPKLKKSQNIVRKVKGKSSEVIFELFEDPRGTTGSTTNGQSSDFTESRRFTRKNKNGVNRMELEKSRNIGESGREKSDFDQEKPVSVLCFIPDLKDSCT